MKERSTVKLGQKVAMGFGDLGYSMISNTTSSFILFFGNTVVGVPGTLMGLAVAIGTMWDGLTDPIVGHLSDKVNTKLFGRRHGFILLGVIMMAIFNILLWSVPISWNSISKFVYFAVMIVLLETANTCFATPNSALSIEISRDYDERSSIQAVRSVFAIVGLLMPTLLMGAFQTPTADYPDGRFNPEAYVNYAYIASSCAIIMGIVMFISTYNHIPRLSHYAKRAKKEVEKSKKFLDIIKSFFGILKNKNFRSVIIGYSVAMMSATIIIAFGFNVFTFTFKTNTMQMYIIMAGLFMMTIAGQPLWLYLSKKTDKKKTMLLGLSISLIGCVMLFLMFIFRDTFNGLLERGFYAVIYLMPPLLVAGLGTGVLFSMPLALIGDVIIVEGKDDDKENTATFTGFMTLAYKASQSISQLILGVLLDIIGFKAGSSVQTPKVEFTLGLILCIGVTVSIVLGILIFSSYSIKRNAVQEELNK